VSGPRHGADRVEREIETALDPGRYVSDGRCFSFVGGLEQVDARVAGFVATEPAQAVTLYETFLAGCYEKAEEVDDSSGSFGMFVTDLVCGWVTASQTAGAPADQIATRVLTWMDDDPYGFCHRLDRDVAAVLDAAGLAAFINQIRARFEAAEQTTAAPGGRSARPPTVGSSVANAARRAQPRRRVPPTGGADRSDHR
jgi:hypothetical protein